jgi:pimeloyl-ACP methyl ester carboxylesterase
MKTVFLIVLLLLNATAFSQNFDEKEVEFWDLSQSFKLSGTLTSPKGLKNFPVAVLISGSGQTDRDETIGKHKIFKTLSEYLSNNGIGVLRYDDRGGFKSSGPSVANSTTQELALDVEAAIEYLQNVEKFENVGLIGHSEGGGIGPMVISKVKDLSFFVSLAGPGVSGKEVLLKQNKDIYLNVGVKEEHISHYLDSFFEPVLDFMVTENDSTTKANKIKSLGENYREKYKGENFALSMNTNETNIPVFMKQLNSKWFVSFIQFDPKPYWKQVDCPTLALNGSLDVQVEVKSNLGAIESLNNKYIKTKVLENHNHLFQVAKTGSLQEYAKIKEAISEETLIEVRNFILKHKR